MQHDAEFEATSRYLEGEHRIHYHDLGSGPDLILLHGSGPGVSGWSNFKGNAPVLAKEFRIVVMDMPGFGLSDKPPIDDVYGRVAAAALARLMDALGIQSAHILGNSMGGAVAATFALGHPERVERLVLMGPGGLSVTMFGPPLSEGRKLLDAFLEDPTRERMAAWVDSMVEDKSVLSEELIDERMANAMRPGAVAAMREILASLTDPRFQTGPPLWARCEAIKHPTLITWGRDDRMLPFEMGMFPFRRMPRVELHAFSRCGHWAQVERKEEFERVVIEFLTRSM
jgi:4,5:9,10-diseco-3-hydroxy-5,9,17-trioxoandrosta-1(10),2-diene-4-oate hydrolase